MVPYCILISIYISSSFMLIYYVIFVDNYYWDQINFIKCLKIWLFLVWSHNWGCSGLTPHSELRNHFGWCLRMIRDAWDQTWIGCSKKTTYLLCYISSSRFDILNVKPYNPSIGNSFSFFHVYFNDLRKI